MRNYDVAILGSGPAGHSAAIQAAKAGKRVVVIDKRDAVGGTSVNTGTIPSKTLREAILHLSGVRQREIYGSAYRVKRDVTAKDLAYRFDHVVNHQRDVVQLQLDRNGVELMFGEGSFVDEHTLRVVHGEDETTVHADFILIGVGSVPAHSAAVPCNDRTILDSDGICYVKDIPRSLIVVGAGVVGTEYACMFSVLGSKVTLIDQRHEILEFLDAEIVQALMYHMRQTGVLFRLGEEVTEVVHESGKVTAVTASHKRISAESLLYSVGRMGATNGLNLEALGVEIDDRGRITVDGEFRTTIPHIFAAGDVIGFPALAATSMGQGRAAIRAALGLPHNGSQNVLPYGMYTIPEIAMVGKSEAELTDEGIPYEVGIARYRETARGQIIGDLSGTLKLLIHSESTKTLGVHIIGDGATELIHIGQALIGLDGNLDYLINNTFNYPTLAECYRIAALDASNKLGV